MSALSLTGVGASPTTPLAPVSTSSGLVESEGGSLPDKLLSAQKFRWLLDAAPYVMLVVDENGQVLAVNHEGETLFGWSEAELLGGPIERLFPQRFQAAHASQRDLLCAPTDAPPPVTSRP